MANEELEDYLGYGRYLAEELVTHVRRGLAAEAQMEVTVDGVAYVVSVRPKGTSLPAILQVTNATASR